MQPNIDNDVLHKSHDIFNEIVTIRRHLHQIPEPGFKETKTSEFLADTLERWQIPHQKDIAGTGIVALIEHDSVRKTVALRADMDALPVEEQTGLPFRSRHKGFFHACGHDMHMTCLLGALKVLNDIKDTLTVNVKAIFQPAEELIPGGASSVIHDGALKDPEVAAIFGLHVEPFLQTGEIAVKPGPMMASTANFLIRIIGKGGHAAKPFVCIDPIPIAAHIITALHTISSRMIDPLAPGVITVTKIDAGTATNVIPDTALLEGSARALDTSTEGLIPEKIEKLVKGIAAGYGADCEFEYTRGANVLVNDETMTKHVREVGNKLLGSENVHDYKGTFGGEDFAEYLAHVPGCFFRLGCSSDTTKPVSLHNSQFNPDEKALIYGTAMLAGITMEFENM